MGDDEALGRPPIPPPAAGGNRLLVIGAVAGSVIFIVLAGFFLRFNFKPRGEDYSKILSYLSTKEAAEVVTELKNLKIPYKLEDKGATILVPRAKADEARLGLANKNLPRGGVVGFEIFDKSGLGTTDFDRRIKFIRAISGELSRNISLIEGVEEARVQIVIPETQLFVGKKSPVTASVLLRLKPNQKLLSDQVSGIVHLVASSVEDLVPENVTVVDINGYILTGPKGMVPPPTERVTEIPSAVVGEQAVVEGATKAKTPLTEDIIDQLNYKDELERRLTDKAQEVLNKFFLSDKARIWVTVELGTSKKPSAAGVAEPQIPWEIKKITAAVLLSDTEPLTEKNIPFENIKNNTYSLVAAAVGYNKDRGDRIEMRRVPFTETVSEFTKMQIAGTTQEISTVTKEAATAAAVSQEMPPPVAVKKGGFFVGAVGLFLELLNFFLSKSSPLTFKIFGFVLLMVLVGTFFWLVYWLRRRRKKEAEAVRIRREEAAAEPGFDLDGVPEIQRIREAAAQQPEKLASVLKAWLTEEQGG